jgi:hypothetical protein
MNDTCIVDQHIQLSFSLLDAISCSGDRIDVSDIELKEVDVETLFLQLLPRIIGSEMWRNMDVSIPIVLVRTELPCPLTRS